MAWTKASGKGKEILSENTDTENWLFKKWLVY